MNPNTNSANTSIGRVIDQSITPQSLVMLSRHSPELFLSYENDNSEFLFLCRSDDEANKIPMFSKCFHHQIGVRNIIITDLRPFSGNSSLRPISFRNRVETELFVFRAALESVASKSGYSAIRDRFIETCMLYGWYVSALLSSSLNLQTSNLAEISIVAQCFYLNLMSDEGDWDYNRAAISARIAGMNRMSKFDVEAVTGRCILTKDIRSMLESIIEITATPRTESLNYKTMLSMTASSYIGYTQTTIVMMALESPCTWMPLCSTVYRDKTKRRCKAAGIISNYSTKPEQFNLRKKLYEVLGSEIPDFDTELISG